eukprot:Cvel_14348.t1-p1 / transcript=Cvel_14348.t1 / gene=Cvel_14348 / organism=Chromera_velia_CCMP2878 / gene_product=hypothetical protein / transcript_product=hypothetical protein / location=Cvel_scaffold1017:1-5539(-) / protein_length=296 / sequence_SO=supercontig / SO=protein_coding / is_pseudo=false
MCADTLPQTAHILPSPKANRHTPEAISTIKETGHSRGLFIASRNVFTLNPSGARAEREGTHTDKQHPKPGTLQELPFVMTPMFARASNCPLSIQVPSAVLTQDLAPSDPSQWTKASMESSLPSCRYVHQWGPTASKTGRGKARGTLTKVEPECREAQVISPWEEPLLAASPSSPRSASPAPPSCLHYSSPMVGEAGIRAALGVPETSPRDILEKCRRNADKKIARRLREREGLRRGLWERRKKNCSACGGALRGGRCPDFLCSTEEEVQAEEEESFPLPGEGGGLITRIVNVREEK